MKKIVLIDPCKYSRSGIVELINQKMELCSRVSIAQTDNLAIASAQIQQWQPELVIADLYPYLIEAQSTNALSAILHASPASRLLLYITHPSKFLSEYFYQRGAWRIISKNGALEKLEPLIEQALFSEATTTDNHRQHRHRPAPLLSPKEECVLNYWMEGMPTVQIANILKIRTKTVYTHKRNIRIKLGADNRLSLYLALCTNRIG